MIEHMKKSDLEGQRIRLVSTTDPYTDLTPGDEGTVVMVDSRGTIHVDWDNGLGLGLIPNEDRFTLI